MIRLTRVCIALMLMAGIWRAGAQAPAAAAPAAPAKGQTAQAKPAAKAAGQQTAQAEDDDGDLIWQQQCSRCHNAPTGFSPRIAGTVVRHMRVRASLSKRQEEQLLSFLNP